VLSEACNATDLDRNRFHFISIPRWWAAFLFVDLGLMAVHYFPLELPFLVWG